MRLLLSIFILFLISCVSNVNVEKGKFQAVKPPNIYGNNRYLKEGINNSISYNANIGKNKTIPLPGVENNAVSGDVTLPETPADINYRLIENTLGFQYYRVTKDDDMYAGWGVGVQNFPYGVLMFGLNGKNIEVGAAAYLGLTIDNASYEGLWGHEGKTFMADSEYEYIKLKDLDILHTYGGINFYASYYYDEFAINYAASISNPWLVDELPVDREYDADVSFWFPVLLMQDIGISYTPNNIKYRLGINQITGIEFPGQYWGASLEMAYLW